MLTKKRKWDEQWYMFVCVWLCVCVQVIAAEGEMNASRALKEASLVIAESPSGLQLRYLQTLNTIAAEKNSTIIFPLPMDMMQAFMKRWGGGGQHTATHTYTHWCANKHTHADTQIHTHTHTHTRMYWHPYTCWHTQRCWQIYILFVYSSMTYSLSSILFSLLQEIEDLFLLNLQAEGIYCPGISWCYF